MSLEHADSFAIYGDDETLLLDGPYASINNVTLVSDPDGVSTQRCLRFDANRDSELRHVFWFNVDDVIGQGGRFWLSFLPTDNDMRPDIFTWRDSANREIAKLMIDTTGRISFYATTDGDAYGVVSLIATTTSPVVTAAGWWHIEAKLDTTTPRLQLRVEGVEKMDENASWTFNASAAGASIYQARTEGHDNSISSGPAMYLKDFSVWNALGSVNNDFLGSVAVIALAPDGDDTLNWTLSTGATAYEILNNNPPLDDSAYMYADNSPPSSTIVTMEDLPSDVSSVKGIVTYVRGRKSDGGDGILQVNMKATGGGTDSGVANPITAGWLYWRDVSEIDPDTTSAWTRTTVNAAKVEIDRTV